MGEACSPGDMWSSLGVCSHLRELGDSLLDTPTYRKAMLLPHSALGKKKKEESGEENQYPTRRATNTHILNHQGKTFPRAKQIKSPGFS